MLIVLTIPQITFGLIAGVYVDRLDRRRIMMASDALRGAMVLGFTLVGSADQLWLLYLIGFAQASVGTLFTPARGALLPNLVPASALLSANSISQTSRIIFGLLGTASAGVLIGAFHVAWPAFLIDSLTFFVSLALISRIRVARHVPESAPAGNALAIFGELAEGMRLIARSRILIGTLVAAVVTMLGIGAVNVLIIPLIINDLRVPVTWFGAVEFAQTGAMILSGSLVAVVASRLKPTGIVSLALIGTGIFIGMTSLVGNIWHLFPILIGVGLMMTPLQAAIATIMQTSVDNKMRGRVGASLNTVISTASLLSMALAGILGEAIGVRSVFIVGGTITVFAGMVAYLIFRTARSNRPSEQIVPASQIGVAAE
jgi:MFS family permease